MTRTLSHPALLLALLLIPLILWGVIIGDAVDIYLHDTYFVIGRYFLTGWLGTFIAVEAFIYLLTSAFRQWKALHRTHIYTMVLVTAGVFFLLAYGGINGGARYYDYSTVYGTLNSPWVSIVSLITVLAFLTGQLAFLINIIAGFIRGKKATL
jgi:heme/copper-type cytochrome/quinol oxidase subunit 1